MFCSFYVVWKTLSEAIYLILPVSSTNTMSSSYYPFLYRATVNCKSCLYILTAFLLKPVYSFDSENSIKY